MKQNILALCLTILLIFGLSEGGKAQNTVQEVTVKFEPMPQHGGPVVDVVINGSFNARFLVDTGTTDTALTMDLVQKLHLPTNMQSGVQFKIARLDKLDIGRLKTPGGDFLVLERGASQALKINNVDGILGLNILEQGNLYINFEKQECSFIYPALLPEDHLEKLGFTRQDATYIPLNLDLAERQYLVDAHINGVITPLVLDTGSTRTIIPQSFSTSFKEKPLVERAVGTVAGTKTSSVYLVAGIKLGSKMSGRQSVLIAKETLGSRTHLLGIDFLAQFNVLFSFSSKRMYLRRLDKMNPSLDSNSQENIEGATVGLEAGIWKVIAINQTSRLFRSGLRQGDTLLSVNGADMQDMVSDQIFVLMSRKAMTSITVERMIDGKKNTVKIIAAP